jgi:hypothetical protein
MAATLTTATLATETSMDTLIGIMIFIIIIGSILVSGAIFLAAHRPRKSNNPPKKAYKYTELPPKGTAERNQYFAERCLWTQAQEAWTEHRDAKLLDCKDDIEHKIGYIRGFAHTNRRASSIALSQLMRQVDDDANIAWDAVLADASLPTNVKDIPQSAWLV